jgi:coenzyme PQQ precursor peptide PqqA
MKWETPSYVDIKVGAEMTSPQGDFDPACDPLFDRVQPAAEVPAAIEACAAE